MTNVERFPIDFGNNVSVHRMLEQHQANAKEAQKNSRIISVLGSAPSKLSQIFSSSSNTEIWADNQKNTLRACIRKKMDIDEICSSGFTIVNMENEEISIG